MEEVAIKKWSIVNAFDDMVRKEDLQGIKILLEMIGFSRGRMMARIAKEIMATQTRNEVSEIIDRFI